MGERSATPGATELEALGVVERQHLSFSQLSTYLSCGTKYELSYVRRVPREPQGAFLGGIAVHGAVAEAEAEGWWRDPEMDLRGSDSPLLAAFHSRFDEAVSKAGGPEVIRWGGRKSQNLPGGEDKAWWDVNGEFMMRRYLVTRQAWEAQGYVTPEGGTEMRVLANLPGVSTPVIGYLDKFLVREVDTETGEVGGYGVVDWKTGSPNYPADPFQFATYARLVKIAHDIDVTWGMAVFLRAPDVKRRIQPVAFLGLVGHMDEMYAGLVEGIEAGRFMPKPSSFCKSCSVRASCWYWQETNEAGT